jgi:hypothetical protein
MRDPKSFANVCFAKYSSALKQLEEGSLVPNVINLLIPSSNLVGSDVPASKGRPPLGQCCNFLGFHQGWPAPGSEDTEFGVLMEQEVRHGEATVYARVQA